MKLIITLLTAFGLLALSGQAMAQRGVMVPTDPGYSAANYKHANKAALARQWENKQGIPVALPATQSPQAASYKNQLPTRQPAGGVTVPHTPNEALANRNYKAGQKPQKQNATDNLTRRRAGKQRTDSAIGD